MAQPAILDTQLYLKHLLHASIKDSPTEAAAIYGATCEYLQQHKN